VTRLLSSGMCVLVPDQTMIGAPQGSITHSFPCTVTIYFHRQFDFVRVMQIFYCSCVIWECRDDAYGDDDGNEADDGDDGGVTTQSESVTHRWTTVYLKNFDNTFWFAPPRLLAQFCLQVQSNHISHQLHQNAFIQCITQQVKTNKY